MQKYLSEITEEEIREVVKLSALFFTPGEIAIMMELDKLEVKEEMENESGNFYEAFQTGRLQNEVELRQSILMLAKAGSSPAQTMAMDMLMKSKIKMLD